MRRMLGSKEEILPEQHKWNLSLIQKDSEPPNVKEEQEDLWSEDEEKTQSSQLHQRQRDESTEVKLLVSSATEHRALKMEVQGDDCGGSEPASKSSLFSHLQPDTDDMQQFLLIKEEIAPKQQEWNLTVDQENIKEEQEKLWISHQGQQLHQLEDADVTKSPFTVVPVKTENNEKPQSSQVHQSQSDQSTEDEPEASSSTVHRTLTAQADGEDSRGQQPASNSSPYSCVQLDTRGLNSDSSETETDDSCEWKRIRELHSGLSSQTNNNVSVSRSRCSVGKKQFNFSELGNYRNDSKQNTEMEVSEKPFSCLKCGKKFGQKCNLITHMRIHTGKKTFSCSECSQRFRGKSDWTRHMLIHTGQKPFACSECGHRFRQKSDRTRHMLIHTAQKPFDCSQCGRKFGQKCHLNRHMTTHTRQKPFDCAECGQRFGQKSSLKTHMMIHTGQKPFGCSECGQRFGLKGSLKAHMITHTGQKPFVCYECGQRFGQKCHLQTHMIIHTGQKPFCCSECGQRFGQKSNLNRHITVHTGQKPFVCSECGKRFGQKIQLNRHMINHTRQVGRHTHTPPQPK